MREIDLREDIKKHIANCCTETLIGIYNHIFNCRISSDLLESDSCICSYCGK